MLPEAAVPNVFGTMDQFCGRQFFHGRDAGDGLGMIQGYTFIVPFISIIITLAPPQISRH